MEKGRKRERRGSPRELRARLVNDVGAVFAVVIFRRVCFFSPPPHRVSEGRGRGTTFGLRERRVLPISDTQSSVSLSSGRFGFPTPIQPKTAGVARSHFNFEEGTRNSTNHGSHGGPLDVFVFPKLRGGYVAPCPPPGSSSQPWVCLSH